MIFKEVLFKEVLFKEDEVKEVVIYFFNIDSRKLANITWITISNLRKLNTGLTIIASDIGSNLTQNLSDDIKRVAYMTKK